MKGFRFKTALFVLIFFTLAISNAFAGGEAYVEGQFAFPLSTKKTVKDTRTWSGLVVSVSDGDKITVLHEGAGEKIGLYGIDTPDIDQPFGKRAKQFTSVMVYGKTIEIDTMGKDQYGRTLGVVTVDGKSLNELLIKNGLAWVYRKFCKATICEDWIDLEFVARYDKIGIWSEPNPIPPWDFRHGK